MIDLSGAPEQRDGGGGIVIPPQSVVKLRLELRKPTGEFTSNHPYVKKSKGGLLGLDCNFHVIAGTYAGANFFDTLWLPRGVQIITLGDGKNGTSNQIGACEDGHAKIHAIVLAARGIHPDGEIPPEAESINDWLDMSGMEFPGKLKAVISGAFVNNRLQRVMGMDRDEYQAVMSGGEVISDLPIPKVPAENRTQGQGSGSGQTQGQTQWGYQGGQQGGGGGAQQQGECQSQNTRGGQGNAGGPPQWATGGQG